MFCAASHPRAASQVQQRQASLPGLNKGGNEKIFCKEHTRAAHFPAWGMVLQPEPQKILSRMGSFLMSNPARLGIMPRHRLEARDAISCERRATFAPRTIVLQLPKMFPLLSGQ